VENASQPGVKERNDMDGESGIGYARLLHAYLHGCSYKWGNLFINHDNSDAMWRGWQQQQQQQLSGSSVAIFLAVMMSENTCLLPTAITG